MKVKATLLVLFMAIAQLSFSQTVNGIPIKDIDAEYMMLVGTYKLLSNKITVAVDFGQYQSAWKVSDNVVKDENGNKLVFNSMIDALNFFAGNGYDLHNAYAVTVGNQNVYHWVLKKYKIDIRLSTE